MAAVLVAGLGASMALGAGAATAASKADEAGAAGKAKGDVFVSTSTAGSLADSARHQADQQHKAADAAKKAKQRAAQKAARDAKRLQLSWVKPVSVKYELSASFGKSGGRWSHNHSGQDFAVKIGTPVKSVHKGTVVKAGGNGAGDGPAYGNAIVIRHSNGEFSQYAHLSQIGVKPGQQVKTGQQIGKSGNTGNSSGPHLHFEVRKSAEYGSAVDPKGAMRSLGVRL
jgi:murein DD-endopeptidase MepM/ murein hydrolase activator NlpD